MGLSVANVAHKQRFLGVVLDGAGGKIQLVWEVQDASGPNGSDGDDELFPFSNAGHFVEVILQESKRKVKRKGVPAGPFLESGQKGVLSRRELRVGASVAKGQSSHRSVKPRKCPSAQGFLP